MSVLNTRNKIPKKCIQKARYLEVDSLRVSALSECLFSDCITLTASARLSKKYTTYCIMYIAW